MDAQVKQLLPQQNRAPDIEVWLPGLVRGKGRAKSRLVTTKTGQQFINTYTPAATRSYEAELRYAGEMAMRRAGLNKLIDEPMRCRITAVFDVPQSWPNKDKVAALAGDLRHGTKPDFDNLSKCVGDAFNKVVWTDDSRVSECTIRKFYGSKPGLFVEVWVLGGSLI